RGPEARKRRRRRAAGGRAAGLAPGRAVAASVGLPAGMRTAFRRTANPVGKRLAVAYGTGHARVILPRPISQVPHVPPIDPCRAEASWGRRKNAPLIAERRPRQFGQAAAQSGAVAPLWRWSHQQLCIAQP